MTRRIVLVLGGTRSGKSRFGLERAATLAGDGPVYFVGTAWRGDPELERRIADHARHRPAGWRTIEASEDLAADVAAIQPDASVLIDGLTLWLSRLASRQRLDPAIFLDGPLAALLAVIKGRSAPVVVVSDEISLGLVPLDPDTRAFRDVLGLTHQAVAALADEVVFMVAGLPLVLKQP
jgi:adenosylcobinamide kinase/adenosylcobinamide-phosphate guanylyltransferase